MANHNVVVINSNTATVVILSFKQQPGDKPHPIQSPVPGIATGPVPEHVLIVVYFAVGFMGMANLFRPGI